jgi:hypothetical protein
MQTVTIALGCSASALDIAWLRFWMSAEPLMLTSDVLKPRSRAIRAPTSAASLHGVAPHETTATRLPAGTGGDCVGPSQLVMTFSWSLRVNSLVGEYTTPVSAC